VFNFYWPIGHRSKLKLKPRWPSFPLAPHPPTRTESKNSIHSVETMYPEACRKETCLWPDIRHKYAHTFGLSASFRLTIDRTGLKYLNSYPDPSRKGQHHHLPACLGRTREEAPHRAVAYLSPPLVECHGPRTWSLIEITHHLCHGHKINL
jgi:hypothetical protein